MTPKERAAMQQALEVLRLTKNSHGIMLMSDPPKDAWRFHDVDLKLVAAIAALREALAEPDMNLNCKSVQARLATLWGYVKADQAEQEPVAWIEIERGIPMFVRFADKYKPNCDGFIPLYDAAIRTKDLTDAFINELHKDAQDPISFARAVIAADREKNK